MATSVWLKKGRGGSDDCELHSALTIAEFNAFRLRSFAPEVRVIYSEGLRKAGLPEQ